MFDNQFVYIPLYYIKDVDNCYFFEERKIYNVTTKKVLTEKVRGGLTRGYNINGKFIKTKDIIKIKAKRLSNNFFM